MTDTLPMPAPLTYRLGVDAEVDLGGILGIVVSIVSLTSVLIENSATGERAIHEAVGLKPWTGTDARQRPIPDLAEFTEEELAVGRQRQDEIEALLVLRRRTKADVSLAAERLGLRVSTLYGLINDYESERSLTCLIPHAYRQRRRRKRIGAETEQIIATAIDAIYMPNAGARATEVITEVLDQLKRAGLKPVAPNTIRARVQALDPKAVDTARFGGMAAERRHHQTYGTGDPARWPLQRIQIDHTVADFFVVSPDGQAVTRPILTLAVDEFSRVVKGFYLSIHRPSTLSVAMALTHGILDKEEFCRRHGLESPYPVWGLDDAILTDNAAEFDSRGLQLGCRQWRIRGDFRPLGQPYFGGRIERLVGTMMGDVRLIPGYTFNSIGERGKDYDGRAGAALTIEEATRRLAIMIVDRYHRSRHSALGTTPLKAYEHGILGSDRIPGRGYPRMPSDPGRLLKDFLPVEYRTVQAYGIRLNHLTYQSDLLRVLASRKDGRKYVVRYDPRNVSVIHFYNPDTQEYYDIPLRDRHRPPVALWEVDDAVAELKRLGHDADDEHAIFRAIARCRQIDAEAARKSAAARRRQERRREDAKAHAAPAPTTAAAHDTIPATVPSTEAGNDQQPTRRVRPIRDLEGW
ncbi:MAG: Mu transposase C-terminal domain-containing protein [Alphaproteobacteria bacterium]